MVLGVADRRVLDRCIVYATRQCFQASCACLEKSDDMRQKPSRCAPVGLEAISGVLENAQRSEGWPVFNTRYWLTQRKTTGLLFVLHIFTACVKAQNLNSPRRQ